MPFCYPIINWEINLSSSNFLYLFQMLNMLIMWFQESLLWCLMFCFHHIYDTATLMLNIWMAKVYLSELSVVNYFWQSKIIPYCKSFHRGVCFRHNERRGAIPSDRFILLMSATCKLMLCGVNISCEDKYYHIFLFLFVAFCAPNYYIDSLSLIPCDFCRKCKM